jgi:hypothetical protein
VTDTQVWANDIHAVSWRVTSTAGTVDLTGATVRLVADPTGAGATVDLPCTVAGDVVTHELDGNLAPGRYRVVVEATRDGDIVTYPDAATGPLTLTVRADLG